MDSDYDDDSPGGSDFEDVTELLYQAAREMAPDEVLLTDGFTLMDSMSAFEIGEPRMDSGMTTEQDSSTQFDPSALLLPEELCWIMDRMFACEIQWHSGNTLSQTVFTLLYIHELQDLNPELLPPDWPPHPDPSRPLELLTVVLRASVFGLLKCCDLAWRELAKKRLYDIEDWQSEKCEVSLLEGVPVNVILRRLEDACHWLRASALPAEQRDALYDRIMLRKHLLELFDLSTTGNSDSILSVVTVALKALRQVQKRPSSPPAPGSPALLAFDPRVSRRLHTVIPIRVVELLEPQAVWSGLEQLLNGWADVDYMRNTRLMYSWQVFGSHSAWLPRKDLPFPYMRSLIQGVFCDKHIVLGRFSTEWLVEHFFLETLGVSYDLLCDILITSWAGGDTLQFEEVESCIVKIASENVKSLWYNPPRRRRQLMRSVLDLQALQDAFLVLQSLVVVSNPQSKHVLKVLPEAANAWKLDAAREIVLSGFQQDLYPAYERPFAYWLVAHIIDQHIQTLERFRSPSTTAGVAVQNEWEYKILFLSSIQTMCIALFSLTSSISPPSARRMSINFRRRYKWLFASRDSGPSEPFIDLPSLSQYVQDTQHLSEEYRPRDGLMLAQEMLSRLSITPVQSLCGEEENKLRSEFAQSLIEVNGKLLELVDQPHIPLESLIWDPSHHPWFPTVILATR
ncbi:Mak10-domain-containing protein [Trametopsis cervina]|nr:Mak10-domain-containing protein [Trametopsis cervina]